MTRRKLEQVNPIVDKEGRMTQPMRDFAQVVYNNQVIVGEGDPDGNIEAAQYSLYIDETTPLSPTQYRKMLPMIAGDRKRGWIQV